MSHQHNCMTVKNLAEYLRVSEKTIRAMANRKTIPCFRVGRALRFRVEDIEKYVADCLNLDVGQEGPGV